MAVPTWTFDLASFSGTNLLALSVGEGDTPSWTMPNDDDYRLAFKVQNYAADVGTAGPFRAGAVSRVGDNSIEMDTGLGAKFTAGDVVIIRNQALTEKMINEVDSSHSGTDVVPLVNRLTLDVEAHNNAMEKAGSIGITGTTGTGSGGTSTITERVWIVDADNSTEWYTSRCRYDHNTLVTLAINDFACILGVTEWLDPCNLYRSDRNTPRTLMSAIKVAPTPAVVPYDLPFMSNGSGHKASAKNFGATIDRYAEQHPPIRLKVNVTAGTDFTGGVDIEGFRTVWSPIRSTILMGINNSCKISIENYEQFQIGDSVTFYDLTADNFETHTITGKTAPDTISWAAAATNSYALDDIVGITQTENVSVAAGVGAYYSADSWVYPLWHNTAGGTEDFSYQVFEMAQGYCGALHTCDNRHGAGTSVGSNLRENEGMYQIAVGEVNSGFISTTAFGAPSGAYSFPRHKNKLIDVTIISSAMIWGIRDRFGQALSGPMLLRGSADATHDFWTAVSSSSNAVFLFATKVAPRKLVVLRDAGDATYGASTNVRVMDCHFESPRLLKDSFTNVCVLQNNRLTMDFANGEVLLSPGTSDWELEVNNATLTPEIVNRNEINNAGRSGTMFNINTELSFRYTQRNCNYQMRPMSINSQIIEMRGASSITYTADVTDGYFSEIIEAAIGASDTRTLESRTSFKVQVVREDDMEPVEDAIVAIYDNTGTELDNQNTDEFGRIDCVDIATHKIDWTNGPLGGGWRFGDTPTAGATETDLGPIDIVVYPPNGTGYEPTHYRVKVPRFMHFPQDLVLILRPPRGPGQFGHSPYGTGL